MKFPPASTARRRHDPAQRLNDMLDPHDGDAAVVHLANGAEQHVAFGLGQSAGDFVEQQQPRPQRQRLRQFELLGIEQRQLPGRNERAMRKSDALQHRLGFLFAAWQRHLAAVDRRRQHVLEHGHVGERFRNLIGAADAEAAAVPRAHAGDVSAVEHDPAAAWRQHAGDHVEQGGLAGAVRSQNADDFARLDFEVDPVDDDEPAEGARE